MEHKASESHNEIVNNEDDAIFSVSDEGILTPPRTPPTVNNFIYEDEEEEDDDHEPTQPRRKRRRIGDGEFSPNLDTSNSNNEAAATFVCEICADDKASNESFGIQNCSHSYCRDCIKNYVASKLQENITSISCPVPDCKGSLDPEYCRPVLPPQVVERWESALRESTIIVSQRFYCPYKDCSTMLVEDVTQVVTESECPNCKRMFCAQCKVAWHAGIGCEEFQSSFSSEKGEGEGSSAVDPSCSCLVPFVSEKLNENEREKGDIMLRNLARKNRWSRCPKCMFYVEKTCGCDEVRCRCGNCFIYAPGQI